MQSVATRPIVSTTRLRFDGVRPEWAAVFRPISLDRTASRADNPFMDTTTTFTFSDEVLDDPELLQADAAAAQHFLETGAPVDPEVKARAWARVCRIREQTFQRIGYINTAPFLLPSTMDDDE